MRLSQWFVMFVGLCTVFFALYNAFGYVFSIIQSFKAWWWADQWVLALNVYRLSMYESSFTGFVVVHIDHQFQLKFYCCCLLRCRCTMGLCVYFEHSVFRLSVALWHSFSAVRLGQYVLSSSWSLLNGQPSHRYAGYSRGGGDSRRCRIGTYSVKESMNLLGYST